MIKNKIKIPQNIEEKILQYNLDYFRSPINQNLDLQR